MLQYYISGETRTEGKVKRKRIKKLGEGGYGKVYAYDINKKGYAIKYMELEDGLITNSIIREIDGLSQLFGSPYIVQLHELDFEAKYVKAVLEMAEIGDLYNYIDNNPNPEQMYKACYNLTMAVYECVQHNVIHRDIKLENVLVFKNTVKLSDFGLCRSDTCSTENNIQMTNMMYTIYYRAPEVLDKKNYTDKADIWALAMTMAGLVKGNVILKPKKDRNKRDYTKEISDMKYLVRKYLSNNTQTKIFLRKELPKASPLFIDLISWMLEIDPDKRPNIYQVLQHPYFANEILPPPLISCLNKLDMRLYQANPSLTIQKYIEAANWLYDKVVIDKMSDIPSFYHALQLFVSVDVPNDQVKEYIYTCWYIALQLKDRYPIDVDEFFKEIGWKDDKYNKQKINSVMSDIIIQLQGGTYISNVWDYIHVIDNVSVKILDQMMLKVKHIYHNTDAPLYFNCKHIAYYLAKWLGVPKIELLDYDNYYNFIEKYLN